MADQELVSLPLPSNCLYKLTNGGFLTAGDLINTTVTELVNDIQITDIEAEEILGWIGNHTNNEISSFVEIYENSNSDKRVGSKSAYELLKKESSELNIVTFCAALDNILGGGIPVKKITEICGPPGVGKTQIGLQLAVDVQIPKIFGGVEGEAVYIDTEGGFTIERLAEIAEETVLHINDTADEEKNEAHQRIARTFSVESILKGVHRYCCNDTTELIAVSHVLPKYLEKNPKVKLIVLDSIASHFRHKFDDLAQRTRLLQGMTQLFLKLAWESQIAVVFINQMTTKISRDQLKEAHLVPALGDSWGHSCTIRIILSWENGQRLAHLVKSPHRKNATVAFDITEHGVRDSQPDQRVSNIEEKLLQGITRHHTSDSCMSLESHAPQGN